MTTTRIYMKPEDFPPPDEMHKYLCVYLYFHKNEAPEPYFIYNTEHDPTNDCSIDVLHRASCMRQVREWFRQQGGFIWKQEIDPFGKARQVGYILRHNPRQIPAGLGMWLINQADAGYF